MGGKINNGKTNNGNAYARTSSCKGYTQAEIAEKLGVSNKAVSRWERDESFPDISIIPIIKEDIITELKDLFIITTEQ